MSSPGKLKDDPPAVCAPSSSSDGRGLADEDSDKRGKRSQPAMNDLQEKNRIAQASMALLTLNYAWLHGIYVYPCMWLLLPPWCIHECAIFHVQEELSLTKQAAPHTKILQARFRARQRELKGQTALQTQQMSDKIIRLQAEISNLRQKEGIMLKVWSRLKVNKKLYTLRSPSFCKQANNLQ